MGLGLGLALGGGGNPPLHPPEIIIYNLGIKGKIYVPIEFYLRVTIVIISEGLVTNFITKLCSPCLVMMECQTLLAGMIGPHNVPRTVI